MRVLLIAMVIVGARPLAGKGRVWEGVAARHDSLVRVAAKRGMSTKGVLLASPLVPLGTRLCVSSDKAPEPICGTVVDIPQPQHRAWQMREERYIEGSMGLMRRLCPDPTGLPKDCPVTVTLGRP